MTEEEMIKQAEANGWEIVTLPPLDEKKLKRLEEISKEINYINCYCYATREIELKHQQLVNEWASLAEEMGIAKRIEK